MKYNCKCGGKIEDNQCLAQGFLVDCLKCNKCEEILFTIEQAKEIVRLRELNKTIQNERKIIKVGSSIAALLPKKVELFGIKEGLVDTVRVLSKNSLEIKFKKDFSFD